MGVAVMAEPTALLQFEQAVGTGHGGLSAFRACSYCSKVYKAALAVAQKKWTNIPELRTGPARRNDVVVLETPFLIWQRACHTGELRCAPDELSLRSFNTNTEPTTFLLLFWLHLQFNIFTDVANHRRELNPDNLPRTSTFIVGQAVRVAKRMMAGENKEGGQALVTAVSFSGDSAMYDVKYLMTTGSEKNLPEGLLSVPEDVPCRASSSSASSSEARREEGLQRELAETKRRYEQQIENLQWQNRQQRAVAVRQNERQKDASRQLAAAGKALVAASEEAERERVLRQFERKVLNDRVEEIVKETEEACSQQREEELAELLKEHRLKEKRLKKENAVAEKERELASQRATAFSPALGRCLQRRGTQPRRRCGRRWGRWWRLQRSGWLNSRRLKVIVLSWESARAFFLKRILPRC
jgi:hypothetical protein